ncbi:lipoprotein [Enterococcus sp. CWB-B31]|uniref:LptM family lipoprotein n=1 Tax=Enterococcus sp. CWB-B31 TaxID=2885159 RepID=UPI001E5004A2|nr:hypothetical protein [Enterococcus sp. CWB-B31]MCB5954017.1 hypothetical protein [Enterococcus sp. CWB-B31]
MDEEQEIILLFFGRYPKLYIFQRTNYDKLQIVVIIVFGGNEMKKMMLTILAVGLTVGLSACGSNGEKTSASTTEQSTKESTEDSSAKEDEKMRDMAEDLEEKGVSIEYNEYGNFLTFKREKSIDYDYFLMRFEFDGQEIFKVGLELKGNIDGQDKESLYYSVSKGRIVEHSLDNTDINALAEVLESLDYSDQEMLEFAQWYHGNN